MTGLVVGFDLDMTLIDSRPGIRAVWAEVVARTGAPVDPDVAVGRLGPPVEQELAHWVGPAEIPGLTQLYRELYPAYAITPTVPLLGARDALDAVHAAGGRTVVVTAKKGSSAWAHVRHLGLAVDSLAGGLWAEQKGAALRAAGAVVYVGDHVSDVAGARAAGALSVAVTTGPVSRPDLLAAGADVVLESLLEFRAWFGDYLADELRRATMADLDGITDCQTACWREAYSGLVGLPYFDDPTVLSGRRERWQERLAGSRTVHVAVVGGRICGVVSSGPQRDPGQLPELELMSLYVRAAHHGTGIGARLLAASIGDRAATLWVFEANGRALAFYSKHGFVADGEQKLDEDTGLLEVRLSRTPQAGDGRSTAP